MSHPTPTLLSSERLEEIQALRAHVRQSLKTAMAGNTGRSVVSFLRVENLLDEGDELQQAFAAYRSQVQQVLQELLDQGPETLTAYDLHHAAEQLGLLLD